MAATHLKAKYGQANEDVRYAEIKELLKEVGNKGGRTADRGSGVPIMILGDFNIKPGDSKDTKARVIPYLLDEEKVVSAYPLDGSVLTTSKVRAGKVKDEQIDYIFTGSGLSSVATLDIPEITEPTRLPGLRYPSDHFSVGADLSFTDS